MNKRIKAFVLLVAVIITSLQLSLFLKFDISASENLGSVTECKIVGDKIIVSGSIKHSVLVSNRESTIAVYKLLPWEDVDDVISSSEPLKRTNMSISFDFELPCVTIADKTSLYAVVLIDAEGKAVCISEPQYPDAITADTSKIGFKGVKTDNTAATLAAHAGSAVIDVYLDKLDNGNKSGHIFNADGDIFYFDREFIKQLDKQVLSYTALGCEILFRFLISPGQTNVPFCYDGRIWSTNKCVVVNDASSLNAIFAYTYFLMSRYDGGEYGNVSGIILGRGADMPILYNYASLVSEDYDTVYARSLLIVGLAASYASGDKDISLIVPVSDSLTEKGDVYAEKFLSAVADYISSHSKLTFTVMCESTHNPYHINDNMFTSNIDSEGTGEDGEEILIPETDSSPQLTTETVLNEETALITDDITVDDNSTLVTQVDTTYEHTETVDIIDTNSTNESYIVDDTSDLSNVSPLPEIPKPSINTKNDGYYCTDSVEIFTSALAKLKKKYKSLNKGFAWCWYPDENTLEGSLGVCYSYNYMKLAQEDADFFIIAFEGAAADRFASMAHLFKYIDTANNLKETQYAREVFNVRDWSDIISGHVSSTGVYNLYHESELQPNILDFVGRLKYMDYSSTNNISGWYDGIFCNSISHQTVDDEGFLQADFNLEEAGFDQAEIGYIFKTAEPLLLGDALTFDVKCGSDDGSLYEIAIYINCGNSTIISNAVIAGGTRCALSVDVRELYNTAAVSSIRISLTRITGSGDCKLNLYGLSLCSKTLDDQNLEKNLLSIRDYLRSDASAEDTNKSRQIIVAVVLLSSVALFSVLFAFANDRRLLNSINTDENSIRKGTRNERY